MLDVLRELPGQPPRRTRCQRNVTTFRDVFSRGQFVIENCVQYTRRPSPGWMNAGEKETGPISWILFSTALY